MITAELAGSADVSGNVTASEVRPRPAAPTAKLFQFGGHRRARRTRLLGHTMTNARPMMLSIGTGPWQRASCDTGAVVTHHEHVVGGNGDLGETPAAALSRRSAVRRSASCRSTYGSSMRFTVDGDPALVVAAGDLVTRQADHPFDEVLLAGPADADEVARWSGRAAERSRRRAAAR